MALTSNFLPIQLAASASGTVIFSVAADSSLARYLCIIVICTFSTAYQGSKILTGWNLNWTESEENVLRNDICVDLAECCWLS